MPPHRLLHLQGEIGGVGLALVQVVLRHHHLPAATFNSAILGAISLFFPVGIGAIDVILGGKAPIPYRGAGPGRPAPAPPAGGRYITQHTTVYVYITKHTTVYVYATKYTTVYVYITKHTTVYISPGNRIYITKQESAWRWSKSSSVITTCRRERVIYHTTVYEGYIQPYTKDTPVYKGHLPRISFHQAYNRIRRVPGRGNEACALRKRWYAWRYTVVCLVIYGFMFGDIRYLTKRAELTLCGLPLLDSLLHPRQVLFVYDCMLGDKRLYTR